MRKKLLCLLAVIMLSSLACFAACAKGQSGAETWQVTKRIGIIGNDFEEQNNALENIVTEVTLTYNGKKVMEGYLFFDISKGSFAVSASVKTEGEPDYTVTYEIDDESVATVTQEGTVTIKGVGETVLSVKAGGISHGVVLIIEDEFTQAVKRNVTVEGGFASASEAEVGSHVTIRPDNDTLKAEHKEFVCWEYYNKDTGVKVTDLWINGNIFRMPDYNVDIKAITKEKLYTLNVVDATIKTCLVDGAAYEAQAVSQDGMNVYSLPYAAEVTLKANAESATNMFVGWDYGSKKNRLGEPGVDEYTFDMPDDTTSVFARFSETRKIEFGNFLFGNSRVAITNGKVEGSSVTEEALEGMNGYRVDLSANTNVVLNGYSVENLQNTKDFSTVKHGSQSVKLIYVNHSDQNLKLEFYANSYSTVGTSGVVEVGPNAKVEKVFVMSAGFHNPYFGLVQRGNPSGGSDQAITLDVVFEAADTYPDGDPMFMFAVAEAEYVTLKQRSTGTDYPAGSGIRGDCYESGPQSGSGTGNPNSGSFGGRKNVNNANGLTNFVIRSGMVKFNSGTPYLFAEVSNLPEYDPDDPYITVYFRLINTGENTGNFVFGLGKDEDVLNDSTRVTRSVDIASNGTYIFGIRYRRTSASDKLIISIAKPTSFSGDFNLVMQMIFNDKLGCNAEDISSAEDH